MEDEHTAELAAREEEIEHLKQLVDSLARRQTSKHEVRACISLGFIHIGGFHCSAVYFLIADAHLKQLPLNWDMAAKA